jgi:hypothetical protein
MRRNELRGMTDGDVNHFAERRLDTSTKGIRRDLCSLRFSFFYVHFLCVYFCLDVYFLTSGASSPECVKPTTEGGGSSSCFLFVCFCFVIFCFVICLCLFLST